MPHKFTKPGGLATRGEPTMFHVVRQKDGAVATDAAPFDTATYPAEGDDNVAVNCVGFQTVLLRATFTGGGSIKVTPRVLDPEETLWFRVAAEDGSVVETAEIDATADRCYELRVWGRPLIFFQVTVTGSVTDLVLYAIPGARY